MGAKEEILKLTRQRRAAERQAALRDVTRLAQTNLEKVVAKDAMDKDYDDPFEYVREVVQHGCESGIVGQLVYYNQASAFYRQHESDIWDILEADRENTGADNILTMLAGMRWAGNVGTSDQLENYLAWYGYETAARAILDRKEQEANEG